jgi:hypothetical protein
MHTSFNLENLRERDHSEDLGVDGRIILMQVLRNRSGVCGLDSSGSNLSPFHKIYSINLH